MNQLKKEHLSNQIKLFKKSHPSCLFITRRRYSFSPEISSHHQTYHRFIHRTWPILRSRYSKCSDIMPDVIKGLKPLELKISDASFYHLFRDSLNGDLGILDHLSAETFQLVSDNYARSKSGLDYEDVFVSAEHFLSDPRSKYPFVDQYDCLVIPDYDLLLKNSTSNANAISFIQSLSRYCSIHHLDVYKIVDERFVPIRRS